MGNYEEGWFGQKGNGWIVAAVIVAVAAAFWIFGSTAWFAPNGEPFPCGSVVSPRFSTPGPCTDKLEVRRNVGILLGAAGIGLAIIGYFSIIGGRPTWPLRRLWVYHARSGQNDSRNGEAGPRGRLPRRTRKQSTPPSVGSSR